MPTPSGSSFLGSGGYANNFAPDVAPDIIGKAAFDPGWGHYEVFGIARFFNDNTFGCVVAPVTTRPTRATPGPNSRPMFHHHCQHPLPRPAEPEDQERRRRRRFGAVAHHQVPRHPGLDPVRQRHRPLRRAQLSDVVVAPDGSLSPIKALHALGGLVLHPWAGLDVYAYAGLEKEQPNYWSILSTGSVKGGGNFTGFGVPNAINTGCNITTAASFTGGTSNCAAINQSVSDVTVGFWQDF